jgi:hypothetical protein
MAAKILGLEELRKEMLNLVPEMRRGPARRALKLGADPVLAKAVLETPQLARDKYVRGVLVRRVGTLKRALKIRTSKETAKNGDVGVFINYKPLKKGAIADFKANTGRKASQNPDDPFYWRWVVFATKRNKNPTRSLQKAGDILESVSLPRISESLSKYFERLNKRKAAK